jgi:hypothetical protein
VQDKDQVLDHVADSHSGVTKTKAQNNSLESGPNDISAGGLGNSVVIPSNRDKDQSSPKIAPTTAGPKQDIGYTNMHVNFLLMFLGKIINLTGGEETRE